LFTSLVCMLGVSSAMAHDQTRFNWSVTIENPYLPVSVYNAPPIVYIQQPTVYIEREPIIHYQRRNQQAYYAEERRRPHRHWKHRHHHRHHHD